MQPIAYSTVDIPASSRSRRRARARTAVRAVPRTVAGSVGTRRRVWRRARVDGDMCSSRDVDGRAGTGSPPAERVVGEADHDGGDAEDEEGRQEAQAERCGD